jgi:hypothetical protein
MATTVTMQAIAGSGLGGTVVGTSSGTTYAVSATGQITNVQQADIKGFLNLGFVVSQVQTGKISISSPLPADLISIVAAVTPSNAALTLAAQPPQPRKLQIRIVIGTTTTTAITAGTLTLVGTDVDGNAITEVISLIENASATVKSANSYSSLTSATVAGYVASGSGTGNTVGIGLSNDFGLPTGAGPIGLAMVKSTKITKVLGTSNIAADDVASTGTLDTVARTFAPTTAPSANGLVDYEFSYTFSLAA